MSVSKTYGPTGYELRNDQGLSFDLADPEAWQYVNCNENAAVELAKGFPEYWRDVLGEGHSSVEAYSEQLAAAHRRRLMPMLAGAEKSTFSLPPYRNPASPRFSVEYRKDTNEDWPTVKEVYPHGGIPPHGRELPNPFFYNRRNEPPDSHFSLDNWLELIKQLFDQLGDEKLYYLNPSALDGRYKKRTRLSDGSVHVRGPRLAEQSQLETLFSHSTDRPVRWGPLCYDLPTVFNSHFCIAGKPRSGKTTLLRLLFQSLYAVTRRLATQTWAERKLRPAEDVEQSIRFIVYDAKSDLVPCMFPPGYVDQLGDEHVLSKLYILNPFDQRGVSWAIAKDADTSANARTIAEILFPQTSQSQEYFCEAARDVATAVMNSLRRKADDKWTFYDLVMALQPENIEAVLKETEPGRRAYETYLTGPRAAPADLLAVIKSKTALWLPVACLWHHAKFPSFAIGMREWVKLFDDPIVLGNHPAQFSVMQELNRVLLNVLTRELLAVDRPLWRTFIYLDEFEQLGHIATLGQLMETGASRNVNLALCFHDVGMLTGVYQQATEGLVGQSTFYAYLAVTNPKTAEWASAMMGSQEILIEQRSSKADGSHDSVSYHPAIRQLVMASEIKFLPPTNSVNGLTAYFAAPHHGPYKGLLPAAKVLP